MAIFKYLPALNDAGTMTAQIKKVFSGEAVLLLGEYGVLSPLAAITKAREAFSGRIYLELIAKNKNRDLIESFLISAASSGFDGVVIASGRFDKKTGMGRPVYDLDPAQILKAAVQLKGEGRLPAGFAITVRSAAAGEAALERARYFLRSGADCLAVSAPPPEELKGRAIFIEEIR